MGRLTARWPLPAAIWLALFCFLIFPGQGSAKTILLETADQAGTPADTFNPGDRLTLNVILDDASEVGGAALTVTFDASAFTLAETPAAPAVDPGAFIAESEVFGPVTDKRPGAPEPRTATYSVGKSPAAGQVRLSGAGVDNTTGGPPATGRKVLFAVDFTVNTAAPSGTYAFGAMTTELLDPAAGWGTDTNGDNTPDTPEPAPVLVGVASPGSPDFDDPVTAFPTLMQTVNASANVQVADAPQPEPTPTPTPAAEEGSSGGGICFIGSVVR